MPMGRVRRIVAAARAYSKEGMNVTAQIKDPKARQQAETLLRKAAANPAAARVVLQHLHRAARDPKAVERMAKLVSTRGYKVLTAKQARTVFHAVVDAKTPEAAQRYFKAYHELLTDMPFCHQSERNRDLLLAHPFKAAKLTMRAVMGKASVRDLPTEAEMERQIKAYLDSKHITFWTKLLKAPVVAAFMQVARNRRNYWHFFAKHWYDRTADGLTVGQHYSSIIGEDWTRKVANAQRQLWPAVGCRVDEPHPESCAKLMPVWTDTRDPSF